MPYSKGWDGVVRSADEVMAQLFGRPWPEKSEQRWVIHPGASSRAASRERWHRLSPAPAGVAGWSPEKDREEHPEAWVPVVPRLRRVGSSAGGTLEVGPILGPTLPEAPGPMGWRPTRTPGPITSELTPPGEGEFVPTLTTCNEWSPAAHAAPLIDPGVHEHLTPCQTDPDTQFRLWVTSVCTTRLHNGGTRLYFFDGKFKDDLPSPYTGAPFPPFVTRAGSSGGNVFKFTPLNASNEELNEFWRHEYTTSPPTPVSNLHFCRDLIGFVDSDDGFTFPIYTPIVTNPGSTDLCNFAKARVYYRWRWDEAGVPQTQARPSANQDGRAGWRSTVIPCRGASVVYQSHAVLRLDLDGDVVYLMLAGRCDGRGRGPSGVDSLASDCCDICAPPGDLSGAGCTSAQQPCLSDNQIPTTDLVLFICPNANFQAGTLGPYGVLRQAPDWTLGQWIGVPTAFESPDERFTFLYVHPQPPFARSRYDAVENPTGLYGMFVARKDDLRAAVREILSGSAFSLTPADGFGLHPGQSEAEVESALEAGRAILAPVFFPLGPIEVCGRGGSSPAEIEQMDWVDEHFLFHNDRLRMYATHVSAPSGGATQPVLDRILRYGVEARYDAEALDAILDGRFFAFAFEEGPIERMQASLLRFKQAPCDVAVASDLEPWATQSTATMEVNDPAADTYTFADGTTAARLLFHCANAGGLMVQWTERALGGERECP